MTQKQANREDLEQLDPKREVFHIHRLMPRLMIWTQTRNSKTLKRERNSLMNCQEKQR